MNSQRFQGFLSVVLVVLLKSSFTDGEGYGCRPLRSKTDPLPPDDRFVLEVEDLQKEYIPGKTYKVILKSTEEQYKFIAFTISVTGTSIPDSNNPRKNIMLSAGNITKSPEPDVDGADISDTCTNAAVEQDKLPKTRVEVVWIAPPKDKQCVTIWAYVAVKPDVWYNNKGPLSKRVCEDRRKQEDMKPKETPSCEVCEEARYELHFQGTWSYNTHPRMYPSTAPKVKFSDIVGASHNRAFVLYDDQRVASEGLKMLAEQGNTTLMEREILTHLGTNVRTVLKATGPRSSSSTITSFRTSQNHHFISLAASIIPSPDWFLGVNNMELCNGKEWAKEVRYNLYPMDAGTDSGLSFETAPEPTTPPQPIAKAKILDGELNPEDMKPFAKLRIILVRTYNNPNCDDVITQSTTTPSNQEGGEEETTEGGGEGEAEKEDKESATEVKRPTVTTPSSNVEESYPEACKVTAWGPFGTCEGVCEDNKYIGYRARTRAFIDKEAADLYNCNKSILYDVVTCEEECEEAVTPSEYQAQGDWNAWAKPGQGW